MAIHRPQSRQQQPNDRHHLQFNPINYLDRRTTKSPPSSCTWRRIRIRRRRPDAHQFPAFLIYLAPTNFQLLCVSGMAVKSRILTLVGHFRSNQPFLGACLWPPDPVATNLHRQRWRRGYKSTSSWSNAQKIRLLILLLFQVYHQKALALGLRFIYFLHGRPRTELL